MVPAVSRRQIEKRRAVIVVNKFLQRMEDSLRKFDGLKECNMNIKLLFVFNTYLRTSLKDLIIFCLSLLRRDLHLVIFLNI